MPWHQESRTEPICDDPERDAADPPPAYDALSIHRSNSHLISSPSAFLGHVEGPSGASPRLDSVNRESSALDVNKSLPSPPSSSLDDTAPSSRNTGLVLAKSSRPRPRKNTSWLSLLPFSSSFSARRVRQSVLSIVSDLAVPPSRINKREQNNVQETFASLAETCAEHKLSLSTILQEMSIVDHTPMYWAVVNYREELLVTLLVHSQPLTMQTISDIRRACLMSSNQALFHALRVCQPPFHVTDGIRVPSLWAASNNLLLGSRPMDKICVQRSSEQGFTISFDIPLWQRRLKVIGQVSIEFIASGRMWSVTFFSADAKSKTVPSDKTKQGKNAWHVMVTLLESSPPTYFDSQLVVNAPPLSNSDSIKAPGLRGARSTLFAQSHNGRHLAVRRTSTYDYSHNGGSPSVDGYSSLSLRHPPPPRHPTQGSLGASSSLSSVLGAPSISIRLGCGNRKLSRRVKSGEPPEHSVKLTTTPDTWSDHGVGYTNAATSPLGEGGLASQLIHDHSRYLSPDGTLRGQLDARFIKSESSKDCVIC